MIKIFFGNVGFNTTEEQIRALCGDNLTVEEVVIARDADGKAKGYGFLLTRDESRVPQFLRRIGKPVVEGRRVYFKQAHGKKQPPRRTHPSGSTARPFRARTAPSAGASGYVGSASAVNRSNNGA